MAIFQPFFVECQMDVPGCLVCWYGPPGMPLSCLPSALSQGSPNLPFPFAAALCAGPGPSHRPFGAAAATAPPPLPMPLLAETAVYGAAMALLCHTLRPGLDSPPTPLSLCCTTTPQKERRVSTVLGEAPLCSKKGEGRVDPKHV